LDNYSRIGKESARYQSQLYYLVTGNEKFVALIVLPGGFYFAKITSLEKLSLSFPGVGSSFPTVFLELIRCYQGYHTNMKTKLKIE